MGLVGIIFEIIVLAACAAAVYMNILFIQACDLLNLQDENNANAMGTLGLFHYQLPRTDKECIEITSGLLDNSTIDDRAFICARICSLLALGFGALLFVFWFFKQCLITLPCSQLLMDLSSTSVQIALALVYIIWFSDFCRSGSNYECTYGDGSLYLILTQVLWMVAGCCTRCMRPGRSERAKERRQQDNEGN